MNRHRLLITGLLISAAAFLAPIAMTAQIPVGNIEELYAAVDNASNAGTTLVLAPGVYMLSATTPSGTTRANRGRLELREGMSLVGVEGDRGAVVIDANNLPTSSYTAGGGRVAAVRMGRGSNSVQWMTFRNARNGTANIDTTLQIPGVAYVTVAHISSSGSQRGLDVINSGLASSGERIEADIIDSEFFDNNLGSVSQAVRLANAGGVGSTINARMIGNRAWGSPAGAGRLLANNGATNSTISVFSSGNRFFNNQAGTIILGAFSANGNIGNGNSIGLEAHGDQFVENTGTSVFFSGLEVIGGENTSIPNGVNNNTVNVVLWGCRMGNNNLWDLYAVGARSTPESIGSPGTNNNVTIEIHGDGNLQGRWQPTDFFANVLPLDPETTNSVTVIR